MSINSILNKKFKKPREKYFFPLKDSSLRNKDLVEGIKVILSKKLTMSNITLKFENMFKRKIKTNHASMVNSGSSANLLALQCLINPYRKKRLFPGDEVLVPALCWSTSFWPIIQSGLKPIFVDVDVSTFNISIKDLLSKINKKTKALMLVHVLGNSTDMTKLSKIIKKHKLILIEDTCESLGSTYKNKYLGTFGDFSTFSFYYSHQISSVEGGMICCKDKNDSDIIKALRSHGWSKEQSNQKQIEKKFSNINKKFLFINSGFNVRPTDIQSAIAISQFKSLNSFIRQRNRNRKIIIKSLINDNRWSNQVKFLNENTNVKPSWFGLSMLMNQRYKSRKNRILNKLDSLGIENRPIISGNFARQPSVMKYGLSKRSSKLINVDIIHNLGFFIGIKTKKIEKNDLLKFKNIFFNSFNNL